MIYQKKLYIAYVELKVLAGMYDSGTGKYGSITTASWALPNCQLTFSKYDGLPMASYLYLIYEVKTIT